MGVYVPTPGVHRTAPSREDLRRPSGNRVGIVLDIYDAPAESPFFQGARCTVLLMATLQKLPNVIIPTGGGGAKNVSTGNLSPTAADLLEEVEEALKGNRALPPLMSKDPRWGSWVVVDWLQPGQAFVSKCLEHPALDPKRRTVREKKPGPWDTAASSAVAKLRASPVALPDAISDLEQIPEGSPPAAFAREPEAAAWKAGYLAGWLAGAEAAYLGRPVDPLEAHYQDSLGPAREDGWRTGHLDGQAAGAQALLDTPPDEPAAIPNPVAPLAAESETADDADGDAEAAITKGEDRYFEWNGARFIIRADGTVLWDTRVGGAILLQASDKGVRITAAGATIDVGNGGKSVVVHADDATVNAKNAEVKGTEEVKITGGKITMSGDTTVAGDATVSGTVKGATVEATTGLKVGIADGWTGAITQVGSASILVVGGMVKGPA